MNQRGEYGRAQVGQTLPARRHSRIAVNLGVIGVGVVVGLASWPSVRKRRPLGFIAMGTSGSMVAVGLTELLFGNL